MEKKILLYYSSRGPLIKELVENITEKASDQFQEVKDHNNCDIIVSDFDSIDDTFSSENLEKLIVLTDKPNSLNILKLISNYSIKHIIGANSNKLIDDFSIAAKLIVSNSGVTINDFNCNSDNDIFLKHIITSSDEINSVIDAAVAKIDFSDYFDSPSAFVKTISNELLTNAVYNAPTSSIGKPKFECQSRTETVFLNNDETVSYTLGRCGGDIYISVEDKFGRLTYDKLSRVLKKCAENPSPSDKEGGAGLGLYLIYSNVNRFILFNEKNVATKIVAIIENTKRYNLYRKRITSFHYYTGGQCEFNVNN